MCFKKGCGSYRKSIRRDEMENAFGDLLEGLLTTRKIVTFARGMFRDIWDQLQAQTTVLKTNLERDLNAIERQIEKLLVVSKRRTISALRTSMRNASPSCKKTSL